MTRITWAELPLDAREAVEQRAGRVTDATSAEHGVMSAFASVLHTRHGQVFVKGIPADAPIAWGYKHEAQVTRVAPLAPPLLWEVEAGGWLLFGYGFLQGRHPDYRPNSPDLSAVMDAVSYLSGHPWPEDNRKKPLADRVAAYVPAGHEKALDGRALAHTDLGEFNLLVTPNGVRVLDWALSCPGPAWADAALLVPRLISAGHSLEQADRTARRVPAYRDADPSDLGVFAQTIHAFWAQRTREQPFPQRIALTEAAARWAAATPLGN